MSNNNHVNNPFNNFSGKIPEPLKKIFSKISMSIVLIVISLIVIIAGFDSYYKIADKEKAVVTRFGIPHSVETPGLHFKLPIIERVEKVDTTIKSITIGYDVNSNTSRLSESMMITKDYNFVNIDFYLSYKVSEPLKFLYASVEPIKILENLAQGCIRSTIGAYDVDEVLTTGKGEIQARIKGEIDKKLEEHDIGIVLVTITIQDAEPPTNEVMQAFKSVETAKQAKETVINNANRYRNERLPNAKAEIDRILQEAETTKAQRINEANSQVARFNAMYAEYVKNPEITKERMFYETMEELLPNLKIIVDGTGNTQTVLPLDSFTNGGE
ncbi:FtsH protease activity modulator HflK [Fusobacterium sp. PH5-44]|uniref:FtsH protease activity modulator HflK n=1 Tax=unclassified Fusobacterium TaxID=2648384 RepID=UPI003D23E6AA